MNLVCPTCTVTNRVPEERLSEHPLCGRCGAPLTAPEPFALTDASFDAYIGKTDMPVLVDFWADWCGPCKMMAPHFEAAANRVTKVRFAKVDTEASQRVSSAARIRSIPTLVLYRGGKELARQSGAMSSAELLRWLDAQLATAG